MDLWTVLSYKFQSSRCFRSLSGVVWKWPKNFVWTWTQRYHTLAFLRTFYRFLVLHSTYITVLVLLWKSHLLRSYCKKTDFLTTFLTLWGGYSKDNFSVDIPILMKFGTVSKLYRPYMNVLVSFWKSLPSETDWRKTRFLSCSPVYTFVFLNNFVANVPIWLKIKYLVNHVFFKKNLFNLITWLRRNSRTKITLQKNHV